MVAHGKTVPLHRLFFRKRSREIHKGKRKILAVFFPILRKFYGIKVQTIVVIRHRHAVRTQVQPVLRNDRNLGIIAQIALHTRFCAFVHDGSPLRNGKDGSHAQVAHLLGHMDNDVWVVTVYLDIGIFHDGKFLDHAFGIFRHLDRRASACQHCGEQRSTQRKSPDIFLFHPQWGLGLILTI